MDQETRAQDVEAPRSQYVSGSAICWESEIVVDNQVVAWNEQDTLVWEQNFLSRCQNAWINGLVQRTEQIGEMAAENHKILEQKVREKNLEWDNLRRQVLEKVQEMENAKRGACQQFSLQVQHEFPFARIAAPAGK